jgi:hypothetical protein
VLKGAYLELTLQHPTASSARDTQRLVQSRLAGEHHGLQVQIVSVTADTNHPDHWQVVAYVQGEQPAPENFRQLATSTLQQLWDSTAPAEAPAGDTELAISRPQLARVEDWEGYDSAADAQAARPSAGGGATSSTGQGQPAALQELSVEGLATGLGKGCLASVSGGGPTTAPPLPASAQRPAPQAGVFDGCPAGGDGDDQQQDTLKNRTDSGDWQVTTVGAILALPVPPNLPAHRGDWTDADRQAIGQYEGLPLQVAGYLAGSRVEGPESCNCHSATDVDYHLWLVDASGTGREQSVVAEVTPRVRASHPGWTIDQLCALVGDQTQVRVSGWLMMDPVHADQVGQTRGTTWEIHPILAFDIQQNGNWVALDTVASGAAQPVSQRSPLARLLAWIGSALGRGR